MSLNTAVERGCDCLMPKVLWEYNDFLGTAVSFRLCCALKKIETALGMTPGTLYEEVREPPTRVWDCEELVVGPSIPSLRLPDGSELHVGPADVPRGAPTDKMLAQMGRLGITPVNMPTDLSGYRREIVEKYKYLSALQIKKAIKERLANFEVQLVEARMLLAANAGDVNVEELHQARVAGLEAGIAAIEAKFAEQLGVKEP